MNPEDYSRDDIIAGLNPVVAIICAVVCATLWVGLVALRHRIPATRILSSIAGLAIATVAWWFLFQFLSFIFSLATSWPLIAIAGLGGLGSEILVWLYQFERELVSPMKGRALLTLRLASLAVLILILVQPVRSFVEEREIDREVAILIDESDSMRLADQRLNPSQKLDRAALFGLGALEKRPPLRSIEQTASELNESFQRESDAIRSAPNLEAGVESRSAALPDFFSQTIESNETLTALLEEAKSKATEDSVRSKLDNYLKRSRDGLARILSRAQSAFESNSPEELIKQLDVAQKELKGIFDTLTATISESDKAFYESLTESERSEIDTASSTSRVEVAERTLNTPVTVTDENGDSIELTLLSALEEKYNLRLYRFAQDISQLSDEENISLSEEPGINSELTQTDVTRALEYVLENTSSESLAGVLLLSDGRHTGSSLPEDSLRQLAIQNSPLSAVPIGGDLGPVDISLLSLKAPESIYLDDRVVVTAEAKLDGFLGQKIEAKLICGTETVDTLPIDVTDVDFRTELRFVHQPKAKGIIDYKIVLEPDEREIFTNNNEWDFKVAVTDDRTNVLLVDSFPRWEFRYLRNLFYGRDKSVHLQYVLTNPDQIYRSSKQGHVRASATRPFGEAEATDLPNSAEEWKLFDVIILGDISPGTLSYDDWAAIDEAVTRQGAMLICISGPRFMPHAHDSEILQKLLPVTYTPSSSAQFGSPEPAYHIELTSPGRNHPVTSQSTSRALNLERWSQFPAMRWRYVPEDMKSTAEVLAFARPLGTPSLNSSVELDGSPGSVEAAIERLANQDSLEKENALISTIRAGLGKVLLLHFDQTWRFRYGVGDTYHHRFWGQATRWGAGPNLRSGNETTRLGTDRLSYTPDDSIEVTAKLLGQDRSPLTEADVSVEVWKEGNRLRSQKLSYRSGSSGLFETSLSGLSEEGDYEFKLVGDEVDSSLAANPDGPSEIATEILVVSTRNPVELAELTADRDFLNRATQLTGGKLAELYDLDALVSSFGAPKETLRERHSVSLWDTWPLLVTFFGFLTAEWIVRRRSGLV
ncbi:MAG: hypothetical protein CMO55_18450 [Verrucomicrobiales bacterium]|nr:hypothetical protein [Verrucomicrobiales bacterium]